ncbi:ATG8-interacting protein 1 isoform X1 [Nymphaea colorata]|nr:ATG8-interacting protein 1 isoform X1 [Nymphaea colorata]
MADREKDQVDTLPRGNDWEVVSLTASAYSASPGARRLEDEGDRHEEPEGLQEEYARSMFMSEHFVFPPCEHENLPLVSDEVFFTGSVKNVPEYADQYLQEESFQASEIDEAVDQMEVHNLGSEEGETDGRTEADSSGSVPFSEGDLIEAELLEEPDCSASRAHYPSDSAMSSKQMKVTKCNGSGLPRESWWKRRAVSLYTQAREANAFWSVFIAAALTGLAILGHRWQQEKLHIQQLKWQISIGDEKLSRIFSPMSRLKDALIGQRGAPLLRQVSAVEQ